MSVNADTKEDERQAT